MIRKTVIRAHFSITTASLNGLLMGLGFLFHFPEIRSPEMQVAARGRASSIMTWKCIECNIRPRLVAFAATGQAWLSGVLFRTSG